MEQEEGEVYEEEDPPARGPSILQYLHSEDEKGDAAGKFFVTVDKKDGPESYHRKHWVSWRKNDIATNQFRTQQFWRR